MAVGNREKLRYYHAEPGGEALDSFFFCRSGAHRPQAWVTTPPPRREVDKGGLYVKGNKVACPRCGAEVIRYTSPVPTVDVIIEVESDKGEKGIVLIYRRNQPRAWALPGGFVDYGETLEQAAVREADEETGLVVEAIAQFHTYSDPKRDPRRHTISTVFIAQARGRPRPGDDAEGVGIFTPENLPPFLAFDHKNILLDYFSQKCAPPSATGGPKNGKTEG